MDFIKQDCLAKMSPFEDLFSLLGKNHIYGSKLTNEVILISGGSADFVFSISAQSDTFDFLALGKNFKGTVTRGHAT